MRSLSSCLDATQDGAGELGEEAFDEVEPGAVLGREGEFEAVRGLLCDPGSGLFGDVRMPLRRSMFASVAGQKPRRPQFVGIAEVLRLPACQRHQPCPRFERDRRLSAGARAIVERGHRAFDHGALNAALDGLMMQSKHPADRKKRRIFPIGRLYPRPFDPARRLRPRLRDHSQLRRILSSERQFDRPTPRCHDLQPQFGYTWPI
jgi:hypothetical protein